MSLDTYISLRELGDMLGVHIQTAKNWDKRGLIPKPLKIGSTKRYSLAAIREWMELGCPTREEMKTKERQVCAS